MVSLRCKCTLLPGKSEGALCPISEEAPRRTPKSGYYCLFSLVQCHIVSLRYGFSGSNIVRIPPPAGLGWTWTDSKGAVDSP